MISQKQLKNIESWFKSYVSQFKSSDPIYIQNIELKKDHTYRVCREISALGESLGLNPQELNLAQTMALLHDVGRFEQYDRYRTFNDFKSEDHAQLSLKVINQEQVLKKIDPASQKLIICAISYHNRAALPSGETERCLFFSKLLRDADKLDILFVVTEYYRNKDKNSNESLELELPNTPQISDAVFKDIISGKSVNAKNIQSLNDFKLLQMAWVYDLNFPLTYEQFNKRKYLEKIRTACTSSLQIEKAYKAVRSFLDSMI
jgi:HD superfamily phosphodiesterase